MPVSMLYFVKPAIVEIELGQLYDKLFRNRLKGDYADFVHFNVNEVMTWYNEAKKFVETIENLAKSQSQS